MNKMLARLLMVAFCSALVPAAAHAAGPSEIRFATEAGYPPFEFLDPSGELQGFDIDIGNEICKRLDAKCVWIDQSFDSLIPGLQARKFDLANSTMTATEARAKVIDFSEPMYIVPVRLAARKGSGLEPTAESLKGKRVGVQQGTTMETYARQNWANNGVTIVAYPSYTDAFNDLAGGRVDATFQEAQNAVEGFLTKPAGADFELTGSTVDDSPILNEPIAMGIRKGNKKLKKTVDEVLREMKADGTMQTFADKYFQKENIRIAP
ncbi:ABC transporter substrate-binding protein [Alcaligenes faecalis]|jgi:lysine/arginine/ornithine transport system substrate-binding protein|uniref:ABC transporter substrate-binding protein n=1 Tax=Alcaligenes faecalis TaxID=511 RepID=A0A0M7C9M5_ALCFA|nr:MULTISPECIES: ABC transporter substrate-binding protein [Alcaligenes]ALO37710.1 ABC transporter substrate-binding protein [Alcaligenes faecalis]ATH98972.1 ABC transporter substrate-binding protein [Alcaligenes faecalis]AYZ91758.1 ABC transporter substrate-binding protein [Alcaligenes faecalis]MBQ0217572.1 ABC transporter substrate-binding protein [Alcaligenes faecalis]MBW4790238.1 ABC transporter substrate-binding protein [Alcaligenes faecalis subsp. faecalis]